MTRFTNERRADAGIRPYGYSGSLYGIGYEYTSSATIGGWPLLHVAGGIDPVTLRPRIAKGIVAIGDVAVGVLAIGGLACGLFTVGGASIGLMVAVGGAALGCGVSIGGVAVGSIAIGGAAVGFLHAVGGAVFVPPTCPLC